jgi:aldose 1-epimerase
MHSSAKLLRDCFGVMPDGRSVERVSLFGENGFSVSIIALGAAIQALNVRDRDDNPADVVLGYETLEPYLTHRQFFGATIGRFSNRIEEATFDLDGVKHRLSANDGRHCLHGGEHGFDRELWSVEEVSGGSQPFVTLRHVSPDGDQGFPGKLETRVIFQLIGPSDLSITFEAVSDRATVVSLTNHSFFNLGGVEACQCILTHELTLHADHFLPVNSDLVPDGDRAPVDGTPFDFRKGRRVGQDIRSAHTQLQGTRGYDHCFLLGDNPGRVVRPAARLVHRGSGRTLDLLTDQPGIQLYTANFLDGSVRGKFQQLYRQSDAICLEPQALPNSPNRPDFPSTRLEPGVTYRHVSTYRFSVN